MADLDVAIASRALNLIGANAISSFEDGITESDVASAFYEPTAQAALTTHPYRFASGQATLSRLVAVPASGWDAAYQIPTGGDDTPAPILIRNVLVMDKGIQYDRYGDKIYCNATADDVVTLDYAFRPATSLWPPIFTHAFMLELASMFAGSITMKADLVDTYAKQSQMWFDKARHADSTQQTPRKVKTSGLLSRRRGQ